MVEFGFNKLDNTTVAVLQGSDETASQPGWYLNGETMLLYPHRHWRGQASLQPARIRRLQRAVEPVLRGQWRGCRKQVSRCLSPRRWRSGSCCCDAASPWCSWSSSSPLRSPSLSCSTPRKRNPPPHRGTTLSWSWCLSCFYSLSGGSFPHWRRHLEGLKERWRLLPPPNTRGQRKTLRLYTCCFNLVDMVHWSYKWCNQQERGWNSFPHLKTCCVTTAPIKTRNNLF